MANPDSSSRLGFRRAFPLDPDPFVRSRTRSLRTKLAALLWPVAVKAHQWFTPRLDLAALDSVLVLGNQKTGSTAIARLLAAYGELGVASDIHLLQSADVQVTNDPAWVGAFIQRARYYFRQSVIKENALTPATGALLDVLPKARPIYITRHPVHNIRSILDRLNLPGTPRPLDALEIEDDGWTSIVDSRHLGFEAADHIASLAQRWTYMTAIYRRHRDRLTLVRYEDFMADKLATIQQLAGQLDIAARQDIRPLLDVPFQPCGSHRSEAPTSFFSADALAIINRHCATGMDALNYEPITASASS